MMILYEDDSLIAVDKPAGVVVHPTYKNASDTVLDALQWRARDWPPGARPSLVGRLDKMTSGIVIAAKDAGVHAAMQRSWPDVEKDYLAVVHGHVVAPEGEIELPIGADPADRRRRIITASGARCVTRFERVGYAPSSGLSLLRCRLITGRTHQIRVHLAASGWPIVGDAVYGDPLIPQLLPRQALHAWRVALMHPVSHDRLRIEAPVPGDFRGLLAEAELSLPA
jgi:23S rRNA pseudouridine1911/1915/1917 synthase